jgi:hypothetical protein
VHNILSVQVVHCFNNLSEQSLYLSFVLQSRPRIASDILIQVAAVDVLNHQCDFIAEVDRIEELHDARVVKASNTADFVMKSLYSLEVLH